MFYVNIKCITEEIHIKHADTMQQLYFLFDVNVKLVTFTFSIEEPFARYEELYDKPWVRIGPYLIGMCVGWILFKTKCIIHFSKV